MATEHPNTVQHFAACEFCPGRQALTQDIDDLLDVDCEPLYDEATANRPTPEGWYNDDADTRDTLTRIQQFLASAGSSLAGHSTLDVVHGLVYAIVNVQRRQNRTATRLTRIREAMLAACHHPDQEDAAIWEKQVDAYEFDGNGHRVPVEEDDLEERAGHRALRLMLELLNEVADE